MYSIYKTSRYFCVLLLISASIFLQATACQTGKAALSKSLADRWGGDSGANILLTNLTETDLVFFHREIIPGREMGQVAADGQVLLTAPFNDYFVIRAVIADAYRQFKKNPVELRQQEVYATQVITPAQGDEPFKVEITSLLAGEGRLKVVNELPHVVEIHQGSWQGPVIAYLSAATDQPSERVIKIPTGVYELRPIVKYEERIDGVLVNIREQQHREGMDRIEIRAQTQNYRVVKNFSPIYTNGYLYLNNLSGKGLSLKNGSLLLKTARNYQVINQNEQWGVFALPPGSYENLVVVIGVNEHPLPGLEITAGSYFSLTADASGIGEIISTDVSPVEMTDNGYFELVVNDRKIWVLKTDITGGKKYLYKDLYSKVKELRTFGFSDWRLPTYDELDMIYENNDQLIKPGNGPYWSCSWSFKGSDSVAGLNMVTGEDAFHSYLGIETEPGLAYVVRVAEAPVKEYFIDDHMGYDKLSYDGKELWIKRAFESGGEMRFYLWRDAVLTTLFEYNGGYNDWRLPSIEELKFIREHYKGEFPFAPTTYWSSSWLKKDDETGNRHAGSELVFDFETGKVIDSQFGYAFNVTANPRVRLVRTQDR